MKTKNTFFLTNIWTSLQNLLQWICIKYFKEDVLTAIIKSKLNEINM